MASTTTDKNDNVDVHHDEHSKSEGQITPPQRESITYDPKDEKKLIRKIDGRLLPILGALYSIALIDRVNVGPVRLLRIRYILTQVLRRSRLPEYLVWRKTSSFTLVTAIPSLS
jgi:hypothetical protein